MSEHQPVLLHETITGLNIRPEGIYVDCTFGRGGHSKEILNRLARGGKLFAFDQDLTAVAHGKKEFASFGDRIEIIHQNFVHIKEELEKRDVHQVDGILYDLGVSSPQLDEAERGFSYHHDAPLDMRMNQRATLTAKTIVNEWPYEKLVKIFFQYGEEKFSKQIARRIEEERKKRPIETTGQLVDLIKDVIPAPARRKGGHPARRVFQALRIAVNNELHVLEESLRKSIDLLKVGGRICVISFHSLEDRIVKTIFKEYSAHPPLPPGIPVIPEEYEPVLKTITKKPIVPSDEEIARNNRARSARLRIAEKLKET